MPSPQTGGPPLVGCPQLLIQHIYSYPPYPESVSSIQDHRTHHAMVTRNPLNRADRDIIEEKKAECSLKRNYMKLVLGLNSC
jgi:hypothetical protein